ncbi:hypothetical protein SPRG_19991 [Saprolegnia parasitica CBS 223.65]|uniref:Uncharacterized protein n=1 Tax=Saprolegnia parasitica (strain CBS 223.65) TaxID=695850 RepID=A0A067CQI5_SAPPC|nr:hypothetical protein SPRG_19991 [Saprolegnia parasitica CBS 223.65]KDO28781.1 hypothetical protein SPRG_19991 [Saprolegnia parasitica CBS 223.65]|eukprot:XP_012200522.1 hypothetical protein SPRG_19991 [Saprolegnia parasitica CBS 223.65]
MTPRTLPMMATSPLKDAMASELKGKPVSPYVKMAAGMAGGVAEACLLQPLDVTKTRLQLDRTGQYKGMIDCGKTIYRTEGGAALYKGLSPFIMHLTLKYALRFGSFAKFKELLGAGEGQLEVWKTLINGLVAGSLGPCLNSPMDVIKTRLMAQETVKGVEPKYRGFVHAFGVIAREEGNAALWKGLVPRLTRMAPGQAITWTVVMRVTSFFENN